MENLYYMVFTTSLFILAFLLLRTAVRNKISMRLQYALWLFVAVKLLVFPVPRMESFLSVWQISEIWEDRQQEFHGKAAEAAGFLQIKQQKESVEGDGHRELQVQSSGEKQLNGDKDSAGRNLKPNDGLFNKEAEIPRMRTVQKKNMYNICAGVAAAGSLFMFFCFLLENLRFAGCLRRQRSRFKQEDFPLPVYLVKGLPSPCLYGKAVYLSPEMAGDEKKCLHMLTHEYCHYRQGDLCWSVLRCLCVICYWWNPLVWLCAYLSKQDCELSCDEAVLKRLGENERFSYGRTLLGLVPLKTRTKDYISVATTMTGGGKNMKQRIQKIAHKSKAVTLVCILSIFTAAVCLVSVSTLKPEAVQTILQPAGNTVVITDLPGKQYQMFKEKEEAAVTDLDEAVGKAVLSHNADGYAPLECVGEGHVLLGKEEKNAEITVYALTMYGEYGFENGGFIKGRGTGVIPTVIVFSFDEEKGYVLEDFRTPMDGAYYISSIHELFPEKYWERCINVNEADDEELTRQERVYAVGYLKQIGRDARIGEYPNGDYPLLTDEGVSVEVSNYLINLDKQYGYPYWIGNLEKLEDGVRYLYEMDLDKDAGEIIYTKSVYDTGEVVEQFRFDMKTGKEIK